MFIVFVILFITPNLINCQLVISSKDDLDSILSLENSFREKITKYTTVEIERIEHLREAIAEYVDFNEKLLSNNEKLQKHVSNPFQAWILINSMIQNWENVSRFMDAKSAANFMNQITEKRQQNYINFPTDSDLHSQTLSIFRLQNVYQIGCRRAAEGGVPNVSGTWKFTVKDCLKITEIAYYDKQYDHSTLWALYSLERLNFNGMVEQSEEVWQIYIRLMEIYAFSLRQQEQFQLALSNCKVLLENDPTNKFCQESIELMRADCVERGLATNLHHEQLPKLSVERVVGDEQEYVNELDYEKLCRTGSQIPSYQNVDNFCYFKMDHPYLRLAPIKTEIISTNPLAIIFRSVISDVESASLIDIARNKMKIAEIVAQMDDGSWAGVVQDRIRMTKNAWLAASTNNVTQQLSQRSQLMINLDMSTAEKLQIGNYGLGGHYRPHMDTIEPNQNRRRIATLLFYFTEPEAGGSTVFPLINVAVQPTKNDALFWHNIDRAGNIDTNTFHAGCPVLGGQKWVANSWIHESAQEFRRTCALTKSRENDEKWLGFKNDHTAHCNRFKC